MKDIRWIQRFDNYKKALLQLKSAVELSTKRDLSALEKQGLIQSFEYVHELSWKVLKNFLEHRGSTEQIFGSKDAVRQGFRNNLLDTDKDWMNMIKSRNLCSHTYNESVTNEIVDEILFNYIIRFEEFERKFESIKDKEMV
ncbi:MAG: Nucleotidyltransferase [uncultured Campylobacterales bacterium]|uniref:Nucleotidyltransferase n=1 Tax=uncultured Campylobacterales bacterium TaxID=352960 RepID=A0A6S6TDP2_9BACT|nr:MAG: Nucleotidyltransferase [uncultured Campylobacterales bacterium]